jgi:lactoylglutathione lyase
MRMLHTMLRVGNLEQSLAFYTEVLGMTLLRKRDYEEGRFTLAFFAYTERHMVEVAVQGQKEPIAIR